MGPQQLAGVLSIVGRGRRPRPAGQPFDEEADAAHAPPPSRSRSRRESHAFFNTGRLYDDGIIDPRDTRTVLGIALSAVHSRRRRGPPRLRRLPDVR